MKKTIISILTLSIVGIIVSSNVSALTYSEDIGINFTFSPSLTVSLSSVPGGSSGSNGGGSNANLVINDLTPGSSSDSNVIMVNVLSNNQNGYELNSSVGNTTYADRNLTHTSSNAIFTSLDYGSSIPNLDSSDYDNKWGYSYSLDNSTWSNYNGLPLYSDTTNIATLRTSTGPSSSTGDDTYFKIAAKASISQVSGEYNNVINFLVVASPNPVSLYDAYTSAGKSMYHGYYKIQDMSPTICSNVEVEESQLQVIDVRDNNVYTIAKLKDNRCWMTTNLNLEGGTQLSHEDTDIPEGYTLPIANGFQEGNRLPESNVSGFTSDTIAYLYNSHSSTCTSSESCFSYYSGTAATVGSGLDIHAANIDAPYSVCPKGWKLPTTRYTEPFDADIAVQSDFYNLAIHYGMPNDVYNINTDAFYKAAGPGTVPNFLLGGYYSNNHLVYGGESGFYWSSTGGSLPYRFYNARIRPESIYTVQQYDRRYALAIRCIANN